MGQLHVLSPGTLILGRDPDLDIPLPWEPTVSRRHLRLTVTSSEVTVTDLGSSNGTFVNEQRVTTSALRSGDRLQLGQCVLMVGQERSLS
jgi:pSer/pThr/pTyr-binding forkhead associated (FHA) protein